MSNRFKKIVILVTALCIIGLVLYVQGNSVKEDANKSQANQVKVDVNKPQEISSKLGEGKFVNRDLVSQDLKNLITKRYGGSASDYYFGLQGGCTDGKYFYYFFIIKNVKSLKIIDCAIEKCSLDANGLMTVNDCRIGLKEAGHANNITYNSKTNQFVWVHNGSGTSNRIHSVSADQNQFFANPLDDVKVSTIYLDCKADTISYNPVRDKYIIAFTGETYDFAVLNSDFKIEKSYISSEKFDTKFGRQGMWCDENYIYFLYSFDSTTNKFGNKLKVYDWSGKHVCDKELPDECGYFEAENIVFLNDSFYIGFYTDLSPSKTYYRINQVYKMPKILDNTVKKK